MPHAGRIKHFLQQWKAITQDPWILDTVQGYRLSLIETPPETVIPPMQFSDDEREVITRELQVLLRKEVIRPARDKRGFVSNIFTVPKSDGKARLILNLKTLNSFVEYQHFKMEDVRCIKDLLAKEEFMCKLDLKDAYLTVPVHPTHQQLLRFQ